MIRFDAKTKGLLSTALQRTFPDRQIQDHDVVALAVALNASPPPQLPDMLTGLDLGPYRAELGPLAAGYDLTALAPGALNDPTRAVGQEKIAARAAADKRRYYWCEATHTRHTPAGLDPFVGKLAMARVSLPATGTKSYNTAIGRILPGDHLIASVAQANAKYGQYLPQPIGRLDAITPTRGLMRFGAVSVLLGYQSPRSKAPFCYILEAGMATGQPKVTYLGPQIGQLINKYSGYKPTPFSCPDHAYTGVFTTQPTAPDEPKNLTITARKVEGGVSQSPYITISIDFSLQGDQIKSIPPAFLLVRAAYIVWSRLKKVPQDCDVKAPPS